MDEFEIELKQSFLEESVDLLEDAEEAFLALESNSDDPEIINGIFRLAHNLKGTSMAVGFNQLSEFTHTAENLILGIKNGEVQVNANVVSVLLDFKDKVLEIVEGLKNDFDYISDIEAIVVRLENAQDPNAVSEPVEPEHSISEAELETLVQEEAPSPAISEAALKSLEEYGISPEVVVPNAKEVINDKNEAQEETSLVEENSVLKFNNIEEKETTNSAKKAPTQQKENDESIRVKLSRIDSLNNIIGELVILQNVISQRSQHHIDDELSLKSISMMNKLFKEIQEVSLSLRMMPLKSTFQKMSRIVRDTSKTLSKDVELTILGENTEVDKTVLEKIADPLVHIVRNAVDHGLEENNERIEVGKPRIGNVELKAFHEGNNLVIEIRDDGKGIDPDNIIKKAMEKGLIKSPDIAKEEALQLIFHPGFSTKTVVTEVSGRGVGMDVVKTNINQLGGEVSLESHVGKGSCFRITLPLTLAIIDGIVIKSVNNKFVVPLSQVNEITHFKSSAISKVSEKYPVVKLRENVVPLFYLSEKLYSKSIDMDKVTVLILKSKGKNFGVVIDDILNQQQIVVKKLGLDVQDKKGIMGSSIMSDGKPALILDIIELFEKEIKTTTNSKTEHKLSA